MRTFRGIATQGRDQRSDGALAARAAEGDGRAFEELYRRHSEAAWRMAMAVTGDAGEAGEAVCEAFSRVMAARPEDRPPGAGSLGPHLLAASRDAALDGLRRGQRLRPIGDLDQRATAGTGRPAVRDGSPPAARAFRSLPERWRSALWLSDAEGMPAHQVATAMGIPADNAAHLVARARAGMRERCLQEHLIETVDQRCRFCVEHLAAYAAGRLLPRRGARVEDHLDGCDRCRGRLRDLENVGPTLRRISVALPLSLAAGAESRWRTAVSAATSASSGDTHLSPAMARAQKPLVAVTSGVFALGVLSAAIVDGSGRPRATRSVAPVALQPPQDEQRLDRPAPPYVAPPAADDGQPFSAPVDLPAPVVVPFVPAAEVARTAGAPAGGGVAVNDSGGSHPPVPGLAPPALPLPEPAEVHVDVALPVAPVELSAGTAEDACSGARVGQVAAGCTDGGDEPTPATGALPVAVTVTTTAPLVGTQVVTLDHL